MMNRNILIFFTSAILTSYPVFAEEIQTKDLVDLNNSHWAFSSVIKTVDKYKLLDCYNDHTFRGEREINRYELSSSILKLIKYIEDTKKISLKNIENENPSVQFAKFSDVPKTDKNLSILSELKNNYNIVLLSPIDKTFSGNNLVTRNEVANAIYQVLMIYINKDSQRNPFRTNNNEKIAINDNITTYQKDEWYKASIKLVSDIGIMSLNNNDFMGDENVSRYQFATTLDKTVDYILKQK